MKEMSDTKTDLWREWSGQQRRANEAAKAWEGQLEKELRDAEKRLAAIQRKCGEYQILLNKPDTIEGKPLAFQRVGKVTPYKHYSGDVHIFLGVPDGDKYWTLKFTSEQAQELGKCLIDQFQKGK